MARISQHRNTSGKQLASASTLYSSHFRVGARHACCKKYLEPKSPCTASNNRFHLAISSDINWSLDITLRDFSLDKEADQMDYPSYRGQQPCSYGSVEGQQSQPSPLRTSQDPKANFSWVEGGIRNGILRWIGIATIVAFVVLGATMATTSDGTQRRSVQAERSVSLAEITSEVRGTYVGASVSSRESSTQEPLTFTALNFYQIRDGKPGQDYPWLKDLKVIEPHQDTTLTVSNARDGFEYQWEVRAGDSNDEDSAVLVSTTGATTVVSLTKLDENVITLKEVNEEGQVARHLDETVMVKYVRREIRSLTDEDLNELLDAVRGIQKQDEIHFLEEINYSSCCTAVCFICHVCIVCPLSKKQYL